MKNVCFMHMTIKRLFVSLQLITQKANLYHMTMNRKLLLLLLFVSFSILAMAQTDFYYYNGNKIPLTLNPEKVCVSTPKDCGEVVERIRANVQVLKTIRDDIFDVIVISRSDYENLTALDFWVEDVKSVIITQSYFTESHVEVYATPYLIVKLKKEEDIDMLTSYAEQYGLENIKQDQLMPLWYTLTVTPESEKSPLECANELWESGEFAASEPDLAGGLGFDVFTGFSQPYTNNASLPVFNLQGHQLESVPSKGIYIQNGKKVVMK